MDFRSSIPGLLLRAEDLRSDASSVSKISITLECCLIPLSYSVSFTVIAILPRVISSLSIRYRYPPRSTEPIPISTVSHPVVLRYRSCQSIAVLRFLAASVRRPRHLSLSSYPLDLILPLFIFVVVLYIHVTNRSIKPHRSSAPREGVLS